MKIQILGAHKTNAPWAFELKVAKGFQALGHRVVLIDYRIGRPPMGTTKAYEREGWLSNLVRSIERNKPDFVLVCRGELLPTFEIFAQINISPPWAVWCCESLDDPDIGEFNSYWLRHHKYAGAQLFLHQSSSTFPEAHILSCACIDPDDVRPRSLLKSIDVLFNGTPTIYRRDWLMAISRKLPPGIQITTSQSHGIDMLEEVQAAKVALNIHLGPVINTETRVAEVIGQGTLLATQPLSLQEQFGGDEYMDVFQSPSQAANQIAEALADAEGREAKAKRAQEWFLANHTFKHRCEELLDVVF